MVQPARAIGGALAALLATTNRDPASRALQQARTVAASRILMPKGRAGPSLIPRMSGTYVAGPCFRLTRARSDGQTDFAPVLATGRTPICGRSGIVPVDRLRRTPARTALSPRGRKAAWPGTHGRLPGKSRQHDRGRPNLGLSDKLPSSIIPIIERSMQVIECSGSRGK